MNRLLSPVNMPLPMHDFSRVYKCMGTSVSVPPRLLQPPPHRISSIRQDVPLLSQTMGVPLLHRQPRRCHLLYLCTASAALGAFSTLPWSNATASYFGADGKEIKDDTLTCDVCGADCSEESYLNYEKMDICPRCFQLDAKSAQQWEDAEYQRWGKSV